MSEWKVENIATLANGKKAKDISTDSPYPIYGGNGIMGHSNTYNADNVVIIGRVGAYCGSVHHSKEKCWISDNAISATAKEGNSIDYLYYLLNSLNLNRYHIGGAQPLMTQGIINNIDIPSHSLSEQKRIAAILSSLDEKIETNRKINARLEELAQALFKSWFIDFEPFGGQMPKDWKTGILSDIANIVMGQSPKGECINSNQHGMIFYQGKTEFGDRFPSVKNFTTNITRVAPVNSVLLSVRAPVGDVNITLNECCIGRGIASIDYKYGSNSFLFLLLKNKTDYFDIFDKGGTVFGCINKKSLEEMPIFLPTTSTIASFNEILHPIDVELERRNNESARLAALRDTLLPKLMLGELKPE